MAFDKNRIDPCTALFIVSIDVNCRTYSLKRESCRIPLIKDALGTGPKCCIIGNIYNGKYTNRTVSLLQGCPDQKGADKEGFHCTLAYYVNTMLCLYGKIIGICWCCIVYLSQLYLPTMKGPRAPHNGKPLFSFIIIFISRRADRPRTRDIEMGSVHPWTHA